MKIGMKLRTLRLYRGMTMKQLGIAAGFPASSADVRIAQYEADARVPKPQVIENLAFALNVHPKFLSIPENFIATDIIHLLLSLDTENTVHFHEKEYTTIQGNQSTECFLTDIQLNSFFSIWNNIKKSLQRGEITLEQYNEWRMNWPKMPDWMEEINNNE